MQTRRRPPLRLALALLLLFAMTACAAPTSSADATATFPSPVTESAPSATATRTPAPPTSTPPPTITQLPISPTPSLQSPIPPFLFAIPIPAEFRTFIDPSYRYATTAGGTREPHNGVEFLNSLGTPVLAAADGVVLFAGDDFANGSPYSPRGWYAFYGNFIIIEHQITNYELPVYTLYAHLSQVLTTTGAAVHAGDEIGLIGFTGAAVGSHLHFEVRYGGTTYEDSRNPELWLQPHAGSGTLAGNISDTNGGKMPIIAIQIRALDVVHPTQYITTYEEAARSGQPPFNENFAIGELPAGSYEITFVAYQLETIIVEIRDGEMTFLTITVGK